MVANNALQRTLHIRFGGQSATGFTIDVDGRQYLVTARHVVNLAGPVAIEVLHGGQWRQLACEVVGRGQDNVDITVLAAPIQLSTQLPLTPSCDEMALGQDVHFLGFPYGLHANVPVALNYDFPLPLVKKACLSLFALQEPSGAYILLDGHNNFGFSGGPVIYAPQGVGIETRVAAVVSGFKTDFQPLMIGGVPNPNAGVQSNTGLVIAYSIKHATDMIAANPIGFVLPQAA